VDGIARGKGRYVGALALISASPVQAQDYSSTFSAEQWIVIALVGMIFVLLCVAYFIPTYIAFKRRHPNRWAILAINVALGGTGIAWLGALVWACNAVHLSPDGSDGGESGLNIFANDPISLTSSGTSSNLALSPDPVEQLLRLKTLLDAGAVSPEEYATLRKPFLDLAMRAEF
jgi:hypothetical protein